MGEKRILTEDDIDRKLAELGPRSISFIDPYKMAQWTLERCCAMVDNGVSTQTVMRAIDDGNLEAYKAGKFVTVEPQKFLTWFKRFKR